MKIISWNVNGIRAAQRYGFFDKFCELDADIFCLQETKAQVEQFPENLKKIVGYHLYTNSAQKKGYSGVAVYTKEKPLKISDQLGDSRFDREGRILRLDFNDFTLINIYIPHGGRQKENLDYKLKVYEVFFEYLNSLKERNVILIGDFNIAHSEIDLARPKGNKNNIMFTLKERAQIDRLLAIGFVDTFRIFNNENGNYTWWSYMREAREKNIGWRIDYCFVSESLVAKIKKAFIMPEFFGSDHCPIGIELDI